MPYIGQPATWVPVHGKIVYINEAHRYFLAEAIVFGYALRECFKF